MAQTPITLAKLLRVLSKGVRVNDVTVLSQVDGIGQQSRLSTAVVMCL